MVGDPIAICQYTKKRTLDDNADGASYEVAVNPRQRGVKHGTGSTTFDDEPPFAVRKINSEAADLLGLSALNSPFRIVSSRMVVQLQVHYHTL